MPTVLRDGPYRFFFYSADGSEPPHVHIQRDDHVAEFWLSPVRLADNGGFKRAELQKIRGMVDEHVESLLRSWNEFFAG